VSEQVLNVPRHTIGEFGDGLSRQSIALVLHTSDILVIEIILVIVIVSFCLIILVII